MIGRRRRHPTVGVVNAVDKTDHRIRGGRPIASAAAAQRRPQMPAGIGPGGRRRGAARRTENPQRTETPSTATATATAAAAAAAATIPATTITTAAICSVRRQWAGERGQRGGHGRPQRRRQSRKRQYRYTQGPLNCGPTRTNLSQGRCRPSRHARRSLLATQRRLGYVWSRQSLRRQSCGRHHQRPP